MSARENAASILEEVIHGDRITQESAALLFKEADLFKLGEAANIIRDYKHPDKHVTFIIDRNINYTNICINNRTTFRRIHF